MADKTWRSYEEVAQYLLDEFADHFGLERVEEKQKIIGLRSGRKIEIDGRGVKEGNSGFVIVECKHYPKARVEAEKLEALAFRITDAGADGGIIVSPTGLQAGAAKIAEGEGIVSVQLNADCTEYEYVLQFLKNVMIGLHDTITFTEKVTVKIEEIKDDGRAPPTTVTVHES
jgi:restriction endonuclease